MVSGNAMSTNLRPCPREGCGGQMSREGDIWKCLQCEREWQSPHQRHKFLESHKDDIIKLYYDEGSKAAREAYGISISGWWTISKRWNLDEEPKKPAIISKRTPKAVSEELIFLRGYKRCLEDLLKGGIRIKLRIIDNTLVLENNEK